MYSDDGTLADDSPCKLFFEMITKGMTSVGKPPVQKETLKKRLEEAGFVDIVFHEYKQILGPWPKDPNFKQIGAMMLLMCDTGMYFPLLERTRTSKVLMKRSVPCIWYGRIHEDLGYDDGGGR